jgi:transposase-like protein
MAMLILRKFLCEKSQPQKGATAMSGSKVDKQTSQVKLIYGAVEEGRFPLERVMEEIGLEFHAFATSAGVLMMKALMEAEEKHLAGKRQSHDTDINRWGTERGSVMLGGQKVKLDRTRLRTRAGREVKLASYERFRSNDARAQAVYERLIAGVSSRDYERTVEEVAEGFGISKSVVNRDMISATAKDLTTLCERDLSMLDLWALLVDGVKVGKAMIVVAIGLDLTGKKHILGFREGSTENARVCTDLFHDMRRRGLLMDHPILVLIDGSKALRVAVEDVFGERAEVARCHFHKCKNVKDYLPKEYHAEYERKMKAAWAMTEYEPARRALSAVVRDLGRINVQAAVSLEEGFEETLTLHRLGVPPVLRVHLQTTNMIESPFSYARRVMHNVKRWRPNTNQAARWIAAGLLQAEKRMRRIKGYKSMAVLRTALEAEAVTKAGVKQINAA